MLVLDCFVYTLNTKHYGRAGVDGWLDGVMDEWIECMWSMHVMHDAFKVFAEVQLIRWKMDVDT